MAKNNKIPGTWTAVPDQLKGIGFDIYEIMIISEVLSWTRQDKQFFESNGRLANEYGCSRMTISRKFKGLIELGILKKGKRVGKGMISYTVDEYKILSIIKERRVTCNVELQQEPFAVTQSYNCCNTELHNNTTKTSSKTSFRVDDDVTSSSSPKPEGPSSLDIELLAKSLS